MPDALTSRRNPSSSRFPRRRSRSADPSISRLLAAAGVDPDRPETIPLVADATGGAENELQVAVAGSRDTVDLPRTIRHSNYFANGIRRAIAGETSRRTLTTLETWLEADVDVWENSWVRFPRALIHAETRREFERDLRGDRRQPGGPRRSDAGRFVMREQGEPQVRVPVSYLLKLALVDAAATALDGPLGRNPALRTARSLFPSFTSDNTSPETCSFHVTRLRPGVGYGRALARETAKRNLLCELLVQYANQAFRLRDSGQHVMLFESPLPPVRQRALNDIISDSFYRELFVSPCLSGWDRGEAKREYMALCHESLSRSQLNAVAKLQETGIITRNLIVLPNTSNVSLSNNGVHVSLGSERLTGLQASGSKDFSGADEKWIGDLVIKIVEHFVPLFVGTFSAAPHRMGFNDFHPERALGYLPHELDFTHLRMLWRRWRKKARNKRFGWRWAPLGPPWVDRTLARVLRLRGDLVPDFRLLDYLMAPMSTESSPALDGSPGNTERLLQDLDDLGVMDRRMSLYTLYRLRDFATRGYSGFEGRFHSLFPSAMEDMRLAVNLQALLTACAFRLVASGRVAHGHIPDRPVVESERRQVVFAAAIGLPTFFVDSRTPNAFLRHLVAGVARTRSSRRYPGRIRVILVEYRRRLLQFLRENAGDLAEAMGISDTLDELSRRLEPGAGASAAERLGADVVRSIGAKHAFAVEPEDYNLAAERYYGGRLRRQRLAEGLDLLVEDARRLDAGKAFAPAARALPGTGAATDFVIATRPSVLAGTLPASELRRLIAFMLLIESAEPDRTSTQARTATAA